MRAGRGIVCALLLVGLGVAVGGVRSAAAARWRVSPFEIGWPSCQATGVAEASGSATAWAVGPCGSDGPATPFVLRRKRGDVWRNVPVAAPVGGSLHAIAAVTNKDIWAVGSGPNSQTLAEHWDGGAWSIVPTPSPGTAANDLLSVVAVSSKNVWAAGYYAGNASHNRTLLERWNGTSWSVVATPNLGTASNALFGLAAVPGHPNRLWAFGGRTTSLGGSQGLILHGRGQSWTLVRALPLARNAGLTGGVATGRHGGVWAVGSAKAGQLVYRRTRSGWKRWPMPKIGAHSALFAAAVIPGTQHVWAVGESVNRFGFEFGLTERWNGTTWQVVKNPRAVTTPFPSAIDARLQAVIATSPHNAWTVGVTNLSGEGDPIVEHYH